MMVESLPEAAGQPGTRPLPAAGNKLLSKKKWALWTALLFCFVSWRFATISSFPCSVLVNVDSGKQTLRRRRPPPVNVVFGLSGNHPGFLSEFEVALKSVLLNAPLERDLHVHILADEDAFRSLGEIFNRTELSTWITRNPIEVHAYDVTPDLDWLKLKIITTFTKALDPKFQLSHATSVHTIGCFFRLVAHHFIPPNAGHLLYMDTDVVIMANLETLWQEVELRPSALFHWGATMVSGFVVMNVARMEEIWTFARDTPMKDIRKKYNQSPNDQLIYLAVNVTYPNEVNVLTEGWDMSVTARWRKKYRPYDEKFPNVGMLHFNGGGRNKEAYFNTNKIMKSFNDTWGNGKHYSRLPWPWARYQARATISPGLSGHLMNISLWGQDDERPWSTKP